MVDLILFLMIGFAVSFAINIALLCIMYINWVNEQIKK